MANTQKSVLAAAATSAAGMPASRNPIIYLPWNSVADATNGVKFGYFVWKDSTSGAADNAVKNGGTGMPLGFAVRELTNPLSYPSAATDVIAAGCEVAVAVQGDFYCYVSDATQVGAVVYANTTTGAATVSSSSTVDTGFRIVQYNSDKMCIISSFGRRAAVAGVAEGGTGLNALGTAGQIMKVNSGATALEWANA